jgi:membrane protein required for colicin V production
MNTFDIVISILLLYGGWKGFKRGLVFEIAMLLGLVIGIYAAFKFSDLIFSFVQKFLSDNGYLIHIISFLVVFGVIVLTFILFAKIIESVLKVTALNIFNKIAGALFGVLKFSLVISVLLLLFLPLQKKINAIPQKVLNESVLYPYILNVSSWIYPVLDDVQKEFRNMGK